MTAPYWSDGAVTLYHGDCEQIILEISEHDDIDFQIVVTSPPYNMGLVPGGNGRGMYRPGASNKGGRFRDGYGEHDDAMPQDASTAAQAAADEREACAQLAEDNNVICWHAQPELSTVPGAWVSFADGVSFADVIRKRRGLLGGTADGAHPPGGAT